MFHWNTCTGEVLLIPTRDIHFLHIHTEPDNSYWSQTQREGEQLLCSPEGYFAEILFITDLFTSDKEQKYSTSNGKHFGFNRPRAVWKSRTTLSSFSVRNMIAWRHWMSLLNDCDMIPCFNKCYSCMQSVCRFLLECSRSCIIRDYVSVGNLASLLRMDFDNHNAA